MSQSSYYYIREKIKEKIGPITPTESSLIGTLFNQGKGKDEIIKILLERREDYRMYRELEATNYAEGV